MKKQLLFLFLAATSLGAACNCNGCGVSVGPSDGGDGGNNLNDGGHGGGPDGGDGGQGTIFQPPGDAGTIDTGNNHNFSIDAGLTGGNGIGVQLTDAGTIVLGHSNTLYRFAWISNDTNGWVSKYDTVLNQEVARYYSVLPVSDGVANGLTYNSGDNHPSRTAVDLNGDMWVANRAYSSGQIVGSVTHILSDPTKCPTRHDGSSIFTSRLLSDGGLFYVVPSTATDVTAYDDCVITTTIVGPDDNVAGTGQRRARGLAVSASIENSVGDVWVAQYDQGRIYKIDSVSGKVINTSADAGFIQLGWGPYGLAVDGKQRLWATAAPGSNGGQGAAVLALIDAKTGTLIDGQINAPVGSYNAAGMYGIAIDGKNRVWLAGCLQGPYAYYYDRPDLHDAGTWGRYYLGGAVSQLGGTDFFGRGRGITVDDKGVVWMSSDVNANSRSGWSGNAAQLIAFYADDGGIKQFVNDAGVAFDFLDFTDSSTASSIGVGVDSDENIWINNYSGDVTKVFRDTGNYLTLPRQTGNLYTYSDFTGYQLRHFTAPQGVFEQVVTGCGTNTTWEGLSWNAFTPLNTSITALVYAANQLSDFSNPSLQASASSNTSPMNWIITQPDGGNGAYPQSIIPQSKYLLVKFILTNTDQQTTPELQSYDVKFNCFGTPPG